MADDNVISLFSRPDDITLKELPFDEAQELFRAEYAQARAVLVDVIAMMGDRTLLRLLEPGTKPWGVSQLRAARHQAELLKERATILEDRLQAAVLLCGRVKKDDRG